jgi:hypothetical protein
MTKRLMLHRAGSQFIKTELPPANTGAHAAAAPSFNGWELLEANLLAEGAFPEAIARAKAKFDAGDSSVILDIP